MFDSSGEIIVFKPVSFSKIRLPIRFSGGPLFDMISTGFLCFLKDHTGVDVYTLIIT